MNNMNQIQPRDLSSSVWNDKKRQKEFIKEEAGLNNKIKNYVEKKTLDEFSLELIDLIKQKIKDVDLSKNDPQNIFLKPFMKHNNIYIEV